MTTVGTVAAVAFYRNTAWVFLYFSAICSLINYAECRMPGSWFHPACRRLHSYPGAHNAAIIKYAAFTRRLGSLVCFLYIHWLSSVICSCQSNYLSVLFLIVVQFHGLVAWSTGAFGTRLKQPYNIERDILVLNLLYGGRGPEYQDAFAVTSMAVLARFTSLQRMSRSFRIPQEWLTSSTAIILFHITFVPGVRGLTVCVAFPDVLKKEEDVVARIGRANRAHAIVAGLVR